MKGRVIFGSGVFALLLFQGLTGLDRCYGQRTTTLERTEFTAYRTNLLYRIDPEVLQALLPAPWVVAPDTSPEFAGWNYVVVLDDRFGIQDPAGKAMGGGKDRIVNFLIRAKNTQTGETAALIHRFFRANPAFVPGFWPKETSLATITRRWEVVGTEWEFDEVRHDVEVRDKTGTLLVEMHIQYQSNSTWRLSPTVAGGNVRSIGHPESFLRIERPDTLQEIVYSARLGIDHRKLFTFRVTAPGLAALFDGSEELIGITARPAGLHHHFR